MLEDLAGMRKHTDRKLGLGFGSFLFFENQKYVEKKGRNYLLN